MNIDHSILTIITFVPLAGAVLLALLPDSDKLMQWGAPRRHPRHLPAHPAPALPLRRRSQRRNLPVRAEHLLDLLARHPLPPRHRWPLHVARRPHRLPRPARRPRLLARHRHPQEALLHPLPPPPGRDVRHLRLARPLPLLRLLGALPRPDGPAHRHLRPHRKPPPRRHQVLPLHLHPLGHPARRDGLALRPHRHLRSPHPLRARRNPQHLDQLRRPLAGLARLPRSLRRQGPGLPAARLALRRRRRSPHRRRHGPRRQTRPLLHPALLLRHLPRAVPPHRPLAHRPRSHRHRLRRTPRPRPERPQAPRRLRHPRPRQRRHPRHLLLHHLRPRRRHLPDPQRGPRRRSPLPPPRLPLRALRHLRHPRIRRPRRTSSPGW